MFDIGATEIIIISVVLVLLFGTKKIPELARGVADTIKILRGEESDETDGDKTKKSKKSKVEKY
jgi:sec-independent protein translocase protein TatA